jgi:hypothetical protein
MGRAKRCRDWGGGREAGCQEVLNGEGVEEKKSSRVRGKRMGSAFVPSPALAAAIASQQK